MILLTLFCHCFCALYPHRYNIKAFDLFLADCLDFFEGKFADFGSDFLSPHLESSSSSGVSTVSHAPFALFFVLFTHRLIYGAMVVFLVDCFSCCWESFADFGLDSLSPTQADIRQNGSLDCFSPAFNFRAAFINNVDTF